MLKEESISSVIRQNAERLFEFCNVVYCDIKNILQFYKDYDKR